MTKRLIILAALLLLVGSPAMAKSRLQVFGAYWDTDDFGSSVGLGLRSTFGDRWGLDIGSWFYGDFDSSRIQVVDQSFLDQEISVSVVDLGIRRFIGTAATRPYVGGGIGYYWFSPSIRPDADDEFGYYLLLGLETNSASKWGLIVDLLYRDVDTRIDLTEVAPIGDIKYTLPGGVQVVSPNGIIDLDFSGVALNFGVVWRPGS
jgi:hypothetical protein